MSRIKDNDTMHIVFPLMGLSKSGGDRVIVQIANGLARRGHVVTLLLSRPVQKPSFPLEALVNIKQPTTKKNLFTEMFWLTNNVPADADVVVGNFYPTSYPATIATLIGKRKGFYFIQGYEPDFFINSPSRKFPILQRILARISYNLPLHKITISSWLRNTLLDKTGHNCAIVNDGVDTIVFSPFGGNQKSKDVNTIMCLGKNDNNKGFGYLLDALHILKNSRNNLHLLVVTQEKNLVVNSPVPTEIVTPVDDKELAACYNRADVFVFPSLREGFGLPPLEAMACGTPVVTTDCGGVLDYAENGINCLIVPPKDPEAMAQAIQKILCDNELAARFCAAGRQTAYRFTLDEMVNKFEKLLVESVDK